MKNYKDTIKFLIETEQLSFDLIQDIEISCDEKTREEFGCEEPIHLLESYYLGDADEEVMNELAKKHNCEDYDELLNVMYSHYEDLCEKEYENIIENGDFLFEYFRDGQCVIYSSSEEKARREYEDYSIVLAERYTALPGLYSFTEEARGTESGLQTL